LPLSCVPLVRPWHGLLPASGLLLLLWSFLPRPSLDLPPTYVLLTASASSLLRPCAWLRPVCVLLLLPVPLSLPSVGPPPPLFPFAPGRCPPRWVRARPEVPVRARAPRWARALGSPAPALPRVPARVRQAWA